MIEEIPDDLTNEILLNLDPISLHQVKLVSSFYNKMVKKSLKLILQKLTTCKWALVAWIKTSSSDDLKESLIIYSNSLSLENPVEYVSGGGWINVYSVALDLNFITYFYKYGTVPFLTSEAKPGLQAHTTFFEKLQKFTNFFKLVMNKKLVKIT